MKKQIYFAGLIVALVGVVSICTLDGGTSWALAAAGQSHAGHDHGSEQDSPAHPEEEIEGLFDEDEDDHEDHGHGDSDIEDDHEGHGHSGIEDDHEGHGHSGIEERHDDHAGHGHAEEADSHAGHGHGDLSGICPEHDVPEAIDALCNGGHLAELRPGEGMMVRLASPEVAAKAGIGSAEPVKISLAAGIDLPGRVQFNRNRLARITPLSAGIIRQVRVQPGAQVAKGDLLARVATPELASLKAELVAAEARRKQAEATYRREEDLLARGVSSRQEFQQAEAEFRAAQGAAEQYRQQLLNYGLTAADLAQLFIAGSGSAVLDFRAPLSGTVVEVNTAVGEAVEPGSPLFTVADLDSLWIELSVPESRIYQARVDAPVQARFDGLPGTVFTGKVFQAGAVLDERSRTLKVLAEVSNPGRRLKVGMFGDARILEGSEQQVLAVPADALQSIDGAAYVFIQEEVDLFELRRVRAGGRTDGMIPILSGLSPGERVVSGQGFALKSEVLKARLGASCADH